MPSLHKLKCKYQVVAGQESESREGALVDEKDEGQEVEKQFAHPDVLLELHFLEDVRCMYPVVAP